MSVLRIMTALFIFTFGSLAFSEQVKLKCSLKLAEKEEGIGSTNGEIFSLTFCYNQSDDAAEGEGDDSLFGCDNGDIKLSIDRKFSKDREVSLSGGEFSGHASDGEVRATGSKMVNSEKENEMFSFELYTDSEGDISEFRISRNGKLVGYTTENAASCDIVAK